MFEALSQVVSLQRRKPKMSSQRFFVALPERHGVVGKAEMMLKIVTLNPQGPNILLVAEGPQTLAFQLVKLGEMPTEPNKKITNPQTLMSEAMCFLQAVTCEPRTLHPDPELCYSTLFKNPRASINNQQEP